MPLIEDIGKRRLDILPFSRIMDSGGKKDILNMFYVIIFCHINVLVFNYLQNK